MKSFITIIASVVCSFAAVLAAPEGQTEQNPQPLDANNRDSSVKPGDDFFLFANGSWIKQTEIPPEYSRWGAFNELIERNTDALHTIAEKASQTQVDPKLAPETRKVGDYYASGMDEKAVEGARTTPLTEEFQKIDAMKDRQDVLKEIAHLHSIGINAFFNFGSGQDAKDSNHDIAQALQGGLGMPDRDYYTKQDADMKQKREKYVAHVTKMLTLLGQAPEKAAEDAKKIMALETKLAEASRTRVELRDPIKNYNKMAVRQLQDLTPDWKWSDYFNSINLLEPGNVNVHQPEFFKAVNNLFKSTALDDWKAYLRWNLINATAPYLSKDFVDEDFDFNQRTLRGTQQNKPRLDWMDEPTKKEALKKLAAMNVKIGYPDKWLDYSLLEIDRGPFVMNTLRSEKFAADRDLQKIGKPVDRTDWGMTPPTVNAYYQPTMNEIVFPAGILRPPFFYANADDAVNYGGIGAVIGHEMTHGFDDQGRQFDADGNLRDWWSKKSADEYNKRRQAVVDQYSAYAPLPGQHVNGELTQGENIADIGGVKLAYAALQKALDKHPEDRNKKIDGLTPEQRFFLSFAAIWRSKIRDEDQKLRLTTDPHSPAQFRVNGPLANMPEFQKAFNVPDGSAMVRPTDKRVNIW